MTDNAKIEQARPQLFEFIDCKQLASRWCLPESSIREQVRSRAGDPLPHIRFGKYIRFRWGARSLRLGPSGEIGRAHV